MGKIKVIIKRPDEPYGHMCHISSSLENLQRTVEGYIETLYITDDVVIICNEEGKLKNLPYNMSFLGNELVGTIIVCGVIGDELTDIGITMKDWKFLVNANMPNVKLPENLFDLKWHLIDEDDAETFPKTNEYVLLSFENYSPFIGVCKGNEDEGFTFYDAIGEKPFVEMGMFVNAWMPLPERWTD